MSRALLPLFRPLVRARLRSGLDGVAVWGLDDARALLATSPVIFAANHVSWWDGLLLFALDEALGAASHVLMDEQNLARLPFFLWTGALPLDRTSPRRAYHGLVRAAAVLQQKRDALWVFPQGRHRPAHVRPLDLGRGVELLWRRSGVPVVSVAIQYVFVEQDRPRAVVALGPALPAAPPAFLHALEAGIGRGLARIDAYALGDTEGFELLVPARRGRAEDGVATRLLAWLLRAFARKRLREVSHG